MEFLQNIVTVYGQVQLASALKNKERNIPNTECWISRKITVFNILKKVSETDFCHSGKWLSKCTHPVLFPNDENPAQQTGVINDLHLPEAFHTCMGTSAYFQHCISTTLDSWMNKKAYPSCISIFRPVR